MSTFRLILPLFTGGGEAIVESPQFCANRPFYPVSLVQVELATRMILTKNLKFCILTTWPSWRVGSGIYLLGRLSLSERKFQDWKGDAMVRGSTSFRSRSFFSCFVIVDTAK